MPPVCDCPEKRGSVSFFQRLLDARSGKKRPVEAKPRMLFRQLPAASSFFSMPAKGLAMAGRVNVLPLTRS